MAGLPNRHVQPGDDLRISAQFYNDVVDSVYSTTRGGGPPAFRRETSVEILIRNDSGADVDQFAILAVGDPIITPTANLDEFKRRKVVSGDTPTATSVIAVTQEPIPDGGIGRAVVAGLTQVKLNVVDASHEYCSPTTVTSDLTTGVNGEHRILFKETGTGSKWGFVLLGDRSRAGETYIVRIPDPATTDEEGLVEAVYIQDFTGLPVANADGEDVLLYLVGG